VGRAAKCGKEEIVGLLAALSLFLEENSEERHAHWLALCEEIAGALRGRSGTTVTVVARKYKGAPAVELALDEDALGLTALALVQRLQDGEPSVHANHARVRDGIVVFGPTCLKPGDAKIVIERVHAELEAHARGG
jgi:L-seryl-tRNA(Ser) seleniumtransferase